MGKIHRYPGIQPFSKDYQSVFYGRNDDITSIEKLLKVNNLVVVYGKSGLGKSSLLNAGLIPKVTSEQEYEAIFIRFGSYNPKYPLSLREIFIEKIKEYLEDPTDLFFSELGLPIWEVALWQWVKTLKDQTNKRDGALLVLDQFEEIFSYPDAEVEAFIIEFSEIINDRMPQRFREVLYEKTENDKTFLEKNQNRLDLIDGDKNIKTVVGIRSDKLSLMDRFSHFLPNVLKNNYCLKALNWEQAKRAITAPAVKADFDDTSFISPQFQFEEKFIAEILNFLSRKGTRPVETFLLQIICQHIEEWVTSEAQNHKSVITVSSDSIVNLDAVVREYYINTVKGTSLKTSKNEVTVHDQLLTRYLIENALIDKMHNNRISLDMALVKQNGLYENLVDRLIDARIIRQEPNTVSGISYELSHDTLIDPVLNSEHGLGNLEDNIDHYYRQHVSVDEQLFLEKHFLTTERKLTRVDHSAIDDILKLDNLETNKIIRDFSPPQEDTSKYEIYPMFYGAVLKMRAEREEKKLNKETIKKRRAIGAIIITLIFMIASIFSTHQAIIQSNIAKKEMNNAEIEKQKTLDANIKLEAQKTIAQEKTELATAMLETVKEQNEEIQSLRMNEKMILRNKLSAARLDQFYKQHIIDSVTRVLATEVTRNDRIDLEVSEDLSDIDELLLKNPTRAINLIQELIIQNPESDAAREKLYSILANPDINFYKSILTFNNIKPLKLSLFEDNRGLIITTKDKSSPILKASLSEGNLISWEKLDGFGTVNSKVKDLLILPNQQGLLIAYENQLIHKWSLDGNIELSIPNRLNGEISSMAYHPLANRVFATVLSNPNKLISWDLNNPRIVKSYREKTLQSVAAGNQKDILLTSDGSNGLFLKDTKTGKTIARYLGCQGKVLNFRFSLDDNLIVSSCRNSNIQALLWDKNIPESPLLMLRNNDTSQTNVISFDNHYRPKVILTGSQSGYISQYDIENGKMEKSYPAHTGEIYDLVITRDNRYIISIGADNSVKVWPKTISSDRRKIIEAFKKEVPYKEIEPIISSFLGSGEIARSN